MNVKKKFELNYSYNVYQNEFGEINYLTSTIGKLPKIKMRLPKISIKQNFELNFL